MLRRGLIAASLVVLRGNSNADPRRPSHRELLGELRRAMSTWRAGEQVGDAKTDAGRRKVESALLRDELSARWCARDTTIRRVTCSAPGRIRTCDLWLRRPTLYPAELRAHDALDPPLQVLMDLDVLAARPAGSAPTGAPADHAHLA